MAILVLAAACGDSVAPLATAQPGVVFTFPLDGQLDVPTGARIVVTFSDPIDESAITICDGDVISGACLLGPDGRAIGGVPHVVEGSDGKTIELTPGELAPGTSYMVSISPAVAPFAENLPASDPLIRFTTRAARPVSAAPTLVAVNGKDPARLAEPDAVTMLDTTTIRLVFSEPLDPRTVVAEPNSVELLVDGAAVPATVIAQGIHVAIDPRDDLPAGARVELRLGNRIADLGGTALAPVAHELSPRDTRGTAGPIPQVLRTRQPGDPGPAVTRAGGASNVISLVKPLIGREESALMPVALAAELGDPSVLGGPIAFTIRRGQRLRATGIEVKLGGEIPVGLSTGDLEIELLTDGGGRIYRNPHQPAEQRPENARAPLYVELAMDVAVYAKDPMGNSVLSQTVLGIQGAGTATATDGVLAIEAVTSMELGLLGVTTFSANLVLELITTTGATPDADIDPPALISTLPARGANDHPVDGGIEMLFSEPVDLDRLRAGGVRLETANGGLVPSVIESHGAAIVVRPLAKLANATGYRVVLADVADVAGNLLPATELLQFATPALINTDVPMTVAAIRPGVPCVLTAGSATSPGRCAGSANGDDLYRPFTLETDQPIEVEMTQPIVRNTVTLGAACGTGSVRVEELSATGACTAAVPGTVMVRDRGFSFVPDRPWVPGARYRLALISGGDGTCNTGELCGFRNRAASFDPLNGTESGDAGGGNLVIDFTGAESTGGTPLFATASPRTDLNGSGFVENGELRRDANRAAMKITGTTGSVGSAEFTTEDCLPQTPEVEACMYLSGSLPATIGELTTNCPLPGGATAPSCVPVEMAAGAMYATSISMDASVVITIGADTGTTVMRMREPGTGPVTGYIIDGGGTPKLVTSLDLYMDAPDMSLPLGTDHDLHSKPLTVLLEGPLQFLPDGRISIALSNTEDLPVTVAIDAALGISGTVEMVLPAHEMKLQLLSRPIRGGER